MLDEDADLWYLRSKENYPTGMDARTESACEWIKTKPITKVLMNPPYENKYGCMTIVENVLDNVPPHTQCAFILPDKKLEKAGKTQIKRILKNHRLRKVMKLPEDLFFGVGVTTSIFIFEAGVPQDGKEFFACYMESDGLVTVKNKGRHDVYGRWADIEAHWIEVMEKQSGDETSGLILPSICPIRCRRSRLKFSKKISERQRWIM